MKSLRFGRLQLVAALWLLFVSVFSHGQVSKGSISGNIVDPTQAILVGAEVKATQVATGQVTTTTSDTAGLFKIPLLAIGTYKVEVSKSGFKSTSIPGIVVTPGVDTGLGSVRLEVGSASETVEVTSGTPLVETTQAQVTATFETSQLTTLPGIQENQGLDLLAVLLPGVANNRDDSDANTNGVGFSVNGIRGRNNDQQIDGQNNNDNSVTGPAVFMADTEFVSQYQVVTNNFGAEYGRNAGSVINVSTKSGTNSFHGSVYGTDVNSALTTLTNEQANTVWGLGLTKPPRFNDEFTGVTLGGPVIKNKLFFFGGFDEEIKSFSNVFTGGETPTPGPNGGIAALTSCFPGSASMAALSAYGPYSIPTGNPTPFGAPNLVYYDNAPVNNTTDPLTGNPACGYNIATVNRTLPNGFHEYNVVSRVDYTRNKDTVYGRYLYQKEIYYNAFGDGGAGYTANIPSLSQAISLSWTHKISDHMLNEVRANYGRSNVEFGGNTLGTVPMASNIQNALANVAFNNAALDGYGPSGALISSRVVNTYQLQDNWNYVWGKHQFKAGVNLTEQKTPNIFLPNLDGYYLYSDWGSYAANAPLNTGIAEGSAKLDFTEHDSFFYFADDWKVNHHLTLNLGLTYSYYGQPANLFHTNDARLQTGSQPFWPTTLPTSVTEFPNLPAPKNSWGPSIGFAYALGDGGWLLGTNKTVIRGGYRLAYDPPFYNIYLNIADVAPQVLAQSITPGQPLPAAPTGPNVRSSLAPFLTFGTSDPRSFNEEVLPNNFSPDRVHSWSFGIQRELGEHAAVEVRYVGNHAQNLFQSINQNPYIGCGDGIDAGTGLCNNPLPGGSEYQPGLLDGINAGVFNSNLLPAGLKPCPAASAPAGVPSAIGRENCNQGIVLQVGNTAYSDYEGLQTEFRTTSLFCQLTMRANYTWQKTTDNVSEIYATGAAGTTSALSQDPFNYTGGEHGLSSLDFPQSFVVSFDEEIPFYHSQKGILGHTLGGWGVSGSYILQSGQVYTPIEYFSAPVTSPYSSTDNAFLGAFNNGLDVSRPFLSNASAPAAAIGVYAADMCVLFSGAPSTVCQNGAPAPGVSPTALYDYTALNASAGATANPVNANQEHFILNAYEAQVVNGTPYGTAGRNSLRDFHLNSANFQVTKTFNLGERVRLNWHMSMTNVFNHPNYGSIYPGIDPVLEDAGLTALGSVGGIGFANPNIQNGGNRVIAFGVKVIY
jgi:hypothetical protein